MPVVLIVEDDADVREFETAALLSGGHEVVVATNGREALEVLEHLQPCIIILDLMMPVMDGLTFLVERRRRDLAPGVPVVCVSAAGEPFLRRARQLGAQECIHKPADMDDLCDCVSQYCGSG
ncbi:response regulator [soil metagenome]